MSNMPKIQMLELADGSGYGLAGFHEFDMWARENIPTWNIMSNKCLVNGFNEDTRLKLIAYSLARKLLAQGDIAAVTNAAREGKRPVMYGIGFEHCPNEFGMVAGPTPDVTHLMSHFYGEEKAFIIRFNADETADKLYKWENNKWEKLP